MNKVNQLVQILTKDHIYIQMHNFPDQDAIASGFALQTLLKKYEIESTLIYRGVIDKSDTLKMIEVLNIQVFEEKKIHLEEEDEIIIVDGQWGNMNINSLGGNIVACIDHHQIYETYPYRFFDIQSNVGSCAALITSYYREENIKIPWREATALLYGIKIDTSNLTRRVSQLDIQCVSYLYSYANQELLEEFNVGSLRIDDLVAYKSAIENLKVVHHVGITHITDECSEAIIATLSDFFIHIKEVKVSIVYALRAGGIRISVRSESKDINAGMLVRSVLQGIGDGGGHDQVAAGFIPNIRNKKEEEKVINKICLRIFEFVNSIFEI